MLPHMGLNSPDGHVLGAGHDGLAICTDGHALHISRVPLECAVTLARGKVPHPEVVT